MTSPDPHRAGPAAARTASEKAAEGRVVPRLRGVPFGVAVGTVSAVGLFALTAFHTWLAPEGSDDRFVWLLGGNFLPGVQPTPGGTLMALLWGAVAGFAAGWLIAAGRNALFGAILGWVHRREQLRRDSRILDDLM